MVDCCVPIQVPGAGLRLEERSDEHACGSDKFKLYECPSCGALWVAHDAFWDHGTWYRKEYIRVEDVDGFNALLAFKRAEMAVVKPVARKPVPLTSNDIARAFQIAAVVDREEGREQNEQGST
jgi:hypothetical protein